jgi:hypothetical protein
MGHLGGMGHGGERFGGMMDDDNDMGHRMPRGMGMGHLGPDFDMRMPMRRHGGEFGMGMGMPMERDKVVPKFGKPTSIEEVLPFYDVELNVA